MPMNTANKLTLLRVFLIPVFLVVMYWGFPGYRYVALAVYVVACLTDLLDGYIARHYNQVSDFGKFADPLADKCLVMAALCRGKGPGHCRRMVRQGQDRQHHGLHLPDALRHSPGAQLCLPGRHPGDHGIFRRGIFRQKLGRVQGKLRKNTPCNAPLHKCNAPAVVCNGKNCYSLSTPKHRSTQKGGCFGQTTRLQCICKGGEFQYGR